MMQHTVKTPVTVRTTSRAPVAANMMIVTTSIPLSSAAESQLTRCSGLYGDCHWLCGVSLHAQRGIEDQPRVQQEGSNQVCQGSGH